MKASTSTTFKKKSLIVPLRNLLDITLEEAIGAVETAGGVNSAEKEKRKYMLGKTRDIFNQEFAQLYYIKSNEKCTAALFSDNHDVVVLRDGEFTKVPEVHTYLIKQGFNVVSALLKQDRYNRRREFQRISEEDRSDIIAEHVPLGSAVDYNEVKKIVKYK
jgi:hypothetical protein